MKKFTVKINFRFVEVLCCIVYAFLTVAALLEIQSGRMNTSAVILLGSIVLIPCILYHMYIKLFYVSVSGSMIEYRNMFGIRRSFDINEIKRVTWFTTEMTSGNAESVSVEFGIHKFSVSPMMENCDLFLKFISSGVSEEKIHRKYKKYREYNSSMK